MNRPPKAAAASMDYSVKLTASAVAPRGCANYARDRCAKTVHRPYRNPISSDFAYHVCDIAQLRPRLADYLPRMPTQKSGDPERNMSLEREQERKLEAVKATLAQQGRWHSLILTVMTLLAVAILGVLLLEILDMRQLEPR